MTEAQIQNLNPQNSYRAANETCIFLKATAPEFWKWSPFISSMFHAKHVHKCFCTTWHLHLHWAHGHLLCTQNLIKTVKVNISSSVPLLELNLPAAFQEHNLSQAPQTIQLRIVLLQYLYLIVSWLMYWLGRNKSQAVMCSFASGNFKPTLHVPHCPSCNSVDQFSWIFTKLQKPMVSCCSWCCSNSLTANRTSHKDLAGGQLWGSLKKSSECLSPLQDLERVAWDRKTQHPQHVFWTYTLRQAYPFLNR